ncbi:MAG: hypothetical protein AVDCRST_MAG19-5005, partial [uncultured Thermomicrobiales bacterium]
GGDRGLRDAVGRRRRPHGARVPAARAGGGAAWEGGEAM